MRRLLLLATLLGVFTACGGAETTVTNGTGAAIAAFELMLPLTRAEVGLRFAATLANGNVFTAVAHWDSSVPPKIPPFSDTEIATHGLITIDLDAAALADLAAAFPIGQTASVLVAAAEQAATPTPGAYHFVHLEVESTLAIVVPDPTILLEYAFVFDEDGILTNNYAATPATNYFTGSDLWFSFTYSNAQGWRLRVFTATSSGDVHTVTEIASAARVVMTGNALILIVPAAEFTTATPNYRVTAFAHDGDFGIPAPHSWTGDAEPRVIEGLQAYPSQD